MSESQNPHGLNAGGSRLLGDALGFLFPVECPGCGHLDVAICPRCLAAFAEGAERVEAGAPRLDRMDGRAILPVWALTAYAGPVREVVIAWKDRGRADLGPLLGALLAVAASQSAPDLAAVLGRGMPRRPSGETLPPWDVLVVPAPSAASAQRRRGREPVTELARDVVVGLGRGGLEARLLPALRQRKRVRDQAGLTGRQRGVNLSRAIVLQARALDPPRGGRGSCGQPVAVLVDDVLTTGATLAAAEQTLAAAGVRALGAFVLAATPSPR